MQLSKVDVKGLNGDVTLPLTINGIKQLETLEDVKKYVFNMDMSMIFRKMTDEIWAGEIGILWEVEDAEYAINQYRQYLYLVKKYETNIAPTIAVDAVWHNHILDTRKYIKDCQIIFGHYLHHYPYFGSRGDEDRRQLEISFENTERLFLKEFGVDITSVGSV